MSLFMTFAYSFIHAARKIYSRSLEKTFQHHYSHCRCLKLSNIMQKAKLFRKVSSSETVKDSIPDQEQVLSVKGICTMKLKKIPTWNKHGGLHCAYCPPPLTPSPRFIFRVALLRHVYTFLYVYMKERQRKKDRERVMHKERYRETERNRETETKEMFLPLIYSEHKHWQKETERDTERQRQW